MTRINFIVAEIKMNFIYKCKYCDNACVGATQRERFNAESPEALARLLNSCRAHSNNVREGWRSMGNDEYVCPECKGKAHDW